MRLPEGLGIKPTAYCRSELDEDVAESGPTPHREGLRFRQTAVHQTAVGLRSSRLLSCPKLAASLLARDSAALAPPEMWKWAVGSEHSRRSRTGGEWKACVLQ